MPFSVKRPHLKTDTALTICMSVLCPPSGPAPLACTTTAYSGRPPLSTRWITTRWLALFDKSCQPRFKLSPGLRAFTAVFGPAPGGVRSPPPPAHRPAPHSGQHRQPDRSHRGGGRGHRPERIEVRERQSADGRRKQWACEPIIGRCCAHPAPEPPAAARLKLGMLHAPERAHGRPDIDARRIL